MGRHRLDIRFEGGVVILPDYPFPARRTRRIAAQDIVEVVQWFPFAIRTVEDEFLSVGGQHEAALRQWCTDHGIPIVQRYDAWSDLLDPFLDTQHSKDWDAMAQGRLAEAGIDADEVQALRARVEGPMEHMTVLGWEWIHYGLYDVLKAMRPWVWTGRARWRSFHADAMTVAARGCEGGATPPARGGLEQPSGR